MPGGISLAPNLSATVLAAFPARGGHAGCERVCVMPFRDPGEQDVRQGVYRDVFTTFPEGHNTDPRTRLERPSR